MLYEVITASIVQIALGGTISNFKIGRVAGAGSIGMAEHQNVSTGPHSVNQIALVRVGVHYGNGHQSYNFV